jgi:hypothetical protein
MKRKKMSNKKSDVIDLKTYRNDICLAMAEEVFKIAQSEAKKYGNDFGHNLIIDLVKSILATVVVNSLLNPIIPKGMAVEEGTILSYRTVKTDILNAISDAFGYAMKIHTGNDTDYLCEIKPIAEPINKKEI